MSGLARARGGRGDHRDGDARGLTPPPTAGGPIPRRGTPRFLPRGVVADGRRPYLSRLLNSRRRSYVAALTRWVLAHKRIVVVTWIVLTIAGVMAAGPATDALDPEFSVPNKEGWETNVEIAKHYLGTGGDTRAAGSGGHAARGQTVDSPGVSADLARLDGASSEALPRARLASYASTGDRTFVSDDGRTTFALIYPQPDPDSVFGENPRAEKAASARSRDATVGGAPVHLTGFDALVEDSGGDNEGPGVLIEALLGGLGALLVLTFVFASFLAVVPIVMAIVVDHDHVPAAARADRAHDGLADRAVPDRADRPRRRDRLLADRRLTLARGARARARAATRRCSARWRPRGARSSSAASRSRSACFALIALPLPFLRSMGYGGMLIPLVSTLVAITLLPVVLAKVGPRLDWPHRRTDDKASRAWTRWAEARLAPALARRRRRHGGHPGARVRRHGPAARHLRRRHDRQVRRREGRASWRSRTPASARARCFPTRS